MAKKKTKKRARKSRTVVREWALGQPLVFPKKKNPTGVNLLARSVVEATIEEPIKLRNPKKAKKRARQSNRVWAITKDAFQNALDILEHAIREPLTPPKRTAGGPLKTKRQQSKRRKK